MGSPSRWGGVVALCALLCLTQPVGAVFWILDEEVCFTEEIGNVRETVTVHFKIPALKKHGGSSVVPRNQMFVDINAYSPGGHILLSERADTEEGVASFVSDETVAGEHSICFAATAQFQETQPQLYVSIEAGRHINWEKVLTLDGLDKTTDALRTIGSEMSVVSAEISAAVEREKPFRSTSESTFTRVWVTSAIQTGLLIVAVLFQVNNLKTFFLAKKLV